MKFCYPWRDYQARVLEAFRLYLADHRLHIVAAPGSGKTTLGIEIFRQLGQPALVLSPTRVIRDQWINRLRDFVPADETFPPAWTSRDLDAPGFLTSITYQALHTRYRDEIKEAETDDSVAAEEEIEIRTLAIDNEEISSLVETLKKTGIKTLILDEAHHLRAEWWKALSTVVESLEGMYVVSLTATPPYDSITTEWKRYEELCGVIDEEISVPELVKAGTLCPHQDFVWTVVPTEYEKDYLASYEANVAQTLTELAADDTLLEAIRNHAWLVRPEDRADSVFREPELAIGFLVYLKSKHIELPQQLSGLLDLGLADIPDISDYWWQLLVNAYLYKPDGWPEGEQFDAHRKRLRRALRDRELLRNRQLQLSDARLIKRHMTQSSAKITACVEIYRHERKLRGDKLRQVILTDYIRDEGVRTNNEAQANVLGAWPIFRELVDRLSEPERATCALLTGRLVVVHESVAKKAAHEVSFRPLERAHGFVLLDDTSRNPVTILTELLEAGTINVLVGTRALLGEGWDAPCINSLILASNVGSYMLTNQMRGRAIRIDRSDPNKVSSIWHIVAIVLDRDRYKGEPYAPMFWPGLADFRELEHRFATFVGVHQTEPRIENNLLRLQLPYIYRQRDAASGAINLGYRKLSFHSAERLEKSNEKMVQRLYRIQEMDARWQDAIGMVDAGKVVPTVSPESPPSALPFHLKRTLWYFLLIAIGAFITGASIGAHIAPHFGVIVGVGLIFALPKFLKAAWLLYKHLPSDGTIHQIGLAVRDTLCATGIIDNSAARLRVYSRSVSGEVYVHLEGGTFHEKSLFADCMEEILGPIQNPRYLLIRHGTTFGIKRKDYHAVPTRIGVRKEFALIFHQAWLRYVGKAELLYTRTPENRRRLLYARAKAFSAGTKNTVKRTDRWV